MSTTIDSTSSVFEVQQLLNGDWRCVSAHSSRMEAVNEAKFMEEHDCKAQMRVVQEWYENASERYVTKVIFRSQAPIDHRKSHEKQKEAAYLRVAACTKIRAQKNKQQRAKKSAWRRNLVFYAWRVIVLVLIGAGGISALYFLDEIL